MRMRVAAAVFASCLALAAQAQDLEAGKKLFEQRCSLCHGGDGNGGDIGPPIAERLPQLDDAQIARVIRQGSANGAMPPNAITDAEMPGLVRFLRTIERKGKPLERRTLQTTDGRTLQGLLLGEGLHDLQLLGDDKSIQLLRRSGERFRPVTSETDWPTYNGDPGGNRYTKLSQIDKTNVARLAPRWMFSVPEAGQIQVTPVVVGGVMYVTNVNECFALDAGSGRRLWHYKRPRTKGSMGAWANRGVAVLGERVFMVTDDAHVIALQRFTGELLWDAEMADWRQNYGASSAPLIAGDLVVTGVSGGEHGANGFVTARDPQTGKEVWRFWAVPKPGDPAAETWRGKDIEHGGAPTWFTGSYDPSLDIVYWPTGNPAKEYDGTDRIGDNLYASSILALERKTGRLVWHFQFTPHDLWDWDATQTSVLIDADWQGRPRKLMLHASRNGFFYVFDRTNGALLLWKPFVKNLTWAKGLDAKGRPIRVPGLEPKPEGTLVCPSQDGATNWFSPSYNPATGLYYVQTFEKCAIYKTSPQGPWESGKPYLGGSQKTASDPKPRRILKAIDIKTGDIKWELEQPGPANSWGGTLATANGLVFVAEDGGGFIAVDALSGKPLWSFETNQSWKASPMTYAFDGKQFVAIASGANILAFALPD
jgi:alcohol dehydrogenase (cytochrome c)